MARCSSWRTRPPTPRSPRDLGCLLEATALSTLPSIGVVLFAGRAAPFRPLVLVLAAAAGAAALGAVITQAACAMPDFRHLMIGHVLAPIAGVAVLTLPLLIVLKRLARED